MDSVPTKFDVTFPLNHSNAADAAQEESGAQPLRAAKVQQGPQVLWSVRARWSSGGIAAAHGQVRSRAGSLSTRGPGFVGLLFWALPVILQILVLPTVVSLAYCSRSALSAAHFCCKCTPLADKTDPPCTYNFFLDRRVARSCRTSCRSWPTCARTLSCGRAWAGLAWCGCWIFSVWSR